MSDKQQVECLALNAYHEARGEGVSGQVAVMFVVKNRLDLNYLGAVNYCDVVIANKQFSWLYDNKKDVAMEQDVYDDIYSIADGFIKGDYPLDMTGGATHYHADYVKPYWSKRDHNGNLPEGMEITNKIGHHIFYKFN